MQEKLIWKKILVLFFAKIQENCVKWLMLNIIIALNLGKMVIHNFINLFQVLKNEKKKYKPDNQQLSIIFATEINKPNQINIGN